ncbi:MAG TPA: hypothetical protein VFB66_29550 [Tepidisphaeraceae bacterium]|nr:hypothetical protein [Tepidisphaeraceae bacterium]
MATLEWKERSGAPLILLLDPGPEAATVRERRPAPPARADAAPRAPGDEKRRRAKTPADPQRRPKPRPGQEARAAKKQPPRVTAERCSGCDATLPAAELTFVWEDAVVCGRCYQRRQAAHILAAVIAPQMPNLSAVAAAAEGRRSWLSVARRFLRKPVKTTARLLGGSQREHGRRAP